LAIFNFSYVKKLLEMHPLSEIIIVDAKFFINHPDFRTWKNSLKSPVFVISNILIEEVYALKHRKNPESTQLFEDAGTYLFGLIKEGQLIDGVYIQDVGWFVACLADSIQELQKAMDMLDAVSKIDLTDSKFLVLAKECNMEFVDNSVVLLTGDQYLNIYCNWYQVPSYYCQRELPDDGLNSWLLQQTGTPIQIDWDKLLLDSANKKAIEASAELSLTLTSKKFIHNWPFKRQHPNPYDLKKIIVTLDVIIAEGYGTIRLPNGMFTFLWRLPFQPWTSELLTKDDMRGEPSPEDRAALLYWGPSASNAGLMTRSDLDFLGHESEVPESIIQDLLLKIGYCEVPYSMQLNGLPSLQSSICLMELFSNRYRFLHEKPVGKKRNTRTEYNYNDLRDSLSLWLSTHSKEEAAKFVDLVTSSWNVGHTIITRLAIEPQVWKAQINDITP